MLDLSNTKNRYVTSYREIQYKGRKILSENQVIKLSFNREGATVFDNDGHEIEFRYKDCHIASYHVNEVFDEYERDTRVIELGGELTSRNVRTY